ncbi:MAG: response regulator transcription factor [Gammaproteobacteria bacterium]|jgi:two-component system copper resistance phosphate regulon response regulator CusR|nr:response regulator transcription factor [Gammaproteobacteria bacterium]
MKILIIEDSLKLQKSLRAGLRRLGYAVDVAGDGEEGLAYSKNGDYDVIVLDLMLPKKSGLEVLREIRESRESPEVLILSARDQTRDRVLGLQQGADDYLVKPFAFDELHARIQALVRRRFKQKSPVITVGKIKIDTSLHIACQGADCLPLTPTEMRILEYLALNRGRVITSAQLINQIYDASSYASRNTIESHISSLRKKLRTQGGPGIIETRRGFGYLIT